RFPYAIANVPAQRSQSTRKPFGKCAGAGRLRPGRLRPDALFVLAACAGNSDGTARLRACEAFPATVEIETSDGQPTIARVELAEQCQVRSTCVPMPPSDGG